MTDIENPFADYGGIVCGDRFLGRFDGLRAIHARTILPRNLKGGSMAVVGLYRIGKSSLVWEAIMQQRETLLERKILPIWINLGTYDTAMAFFRSLVMRCAKALKDCDWLTAPIQREVDRLIRSDVPFNESFARIERFFELVHRANIRPVVVLDEFDHARHLFRGDISGFQELRELAYRPEWKVVFILVGRRTIRDIELATRSISTFALICKSYYVPMFGDDEIHAYLEILGDIGIIIDESMMNDLDYYCGRHPFLLDVLGHEVVEQFRHGRQVDIHAVVRYCDHEFVDYYDYLIELLSEDGSLVKLLGVLFGPIIDIRQQDVNELLNYGLIKAAPGEDQGAVLDGGAYVAFSGHFHSYLRLIARDIDLWPLWSETERQLRQVIDAVMQHQHGDGWFEALERAHSRLGAEKNGRSVYQRCRAAMRREEREWGGRASQNPLDFTYPRELFQIIFAEWNAFQPHFGHDEDYWNEREKLLVKVRNPLAHSRATVISESECLRAESYCKEILELLSQGNGVAGLPSDH